MRKDYIPLTALAPGSINQMLRQAYAEWDQFSKWEVEWQDYDKQIFAMPDTVGKCGKVTLLNGIPAGFVSWDPRNYPEFVIIGHNCVLPQFRKQGIGKAQMRDALEFLAYMGFRAARVSTGVDIFFLPARTMYISCGFEERPAYQDGGPNVACYEKPLQRTNNI